MAFAEDRSITEFDRKEIKQLDWQVVNDGVMGGLSKGKITMPKKGILNFSGILSLENNGGFSSIRSGDVQLDLSDFDGLVARVKGDGRKYKMRLNTEASYRGMNVSFMAEFPTKKDSWTEVKVPFSKFTGSWRGMSLKDKKFDPSKISRLGLIIADKKTGPFTLEIDWIRAYSSSSNTIVDLAVSDGRFSTLATALTKAELVKTLAGDGPFTVFAPTDKAFAKLPKGTIETLLKPENRDQLQAILKHHVVSGSVDLSAALKAGEANSLQGDPLTVGFSEGRIRVGEATILNADIRGSNGIIHIIDSVLIPPTPTPANDILGIAQSAGTFKTLLAAVDAAGLTSALQGDGPFTILAPTDEAFKTLPAGTVANLLKEENLGKLKEILTLHAIAGKVTAGDALNTKNARSMSGQKLTFEVKDGMLKVNGATIRTTDIPCDNGIIHVIDAVLHPACEEASSDCEERCPTTSNPTTLIENAIGQGVPIFNGGDHEACAKIYQDCLISLTEDSRVEPRMRKAMETILEANSGHECDTEKAWIYRKSLDHAYEAMLSSKS